MPKNNLKPSVLLPAAGIKKPQGAEATQDEPGIIAIKLPSPSQLWATGDNAVWTAVRRQYSNAVAAVGSSGKSHKAAYPSLDRWYLLELSPCLQPPQPPPGSGGREGGGSTLHTGCEGVTRHITRQQLEKLVEWKLARGQWRPRLLSYAREQPEGAVEAASAKALATMRDYLPPHAAADAATSAAASATTAKQHCDTALRTAVEALTALKGVGPATASALLSAACPYVPYMGDEALATCLPAGRQSDYSIKAYLELTSRLQYKATELNRQQQDEATGDFQSTPGPRTGFSTAAEDGSDGGDDDDDGYDDNVAAASTAVRSGDKDQPPQPSDDTILVQQYSSGRVDGTASGCGSGSGSGGANASTRMAANGDCGGGGRKHAALCQWTAADVERSLWVAAVLSQLPHPQQTPEVKQPGDSGDGDRRVAGRGKGAASGPSKRARR